MGEMMKKIFMISALLIVSIFNYACIGKIPNGYAQMARTSSLSWLILQDKYKYAEGYDETSKYFRDNVKKGEWISALNNLRRTLGDFKKRKEIYIAYETKLYNSPEAEYIIICYETLFKERTVIETVILMKENNNWKVSGYYLK
jgi:hypothetical protein